MAPLTRVQGPGLNFLSMRSPDALVVGHRVRPIRFEIAADDIAAKDICRGPMVPRLLSACALNGRKAVVLLQEVATSGRKVASVSVAAEGQ